MSYYSQDELNEIGFKRLGHDVQLSRKASIYGASRISIGDATRIDDYCVVSAGEGGIDIGSYIHISVMCSIIGNGHIEMADYSGLSSRVSVYSSNDDYSGSFMTNPTLPPGFTNVDSRPVVIGKHCIVGSGSILLPGTTMETGSALGALSLAKGTLREFMVYMGSPAREIKARKRGMLELEAKLQRRAV